MAHGVPGEHGLPVVSLVVEEHVLGLNSATVLLQLMEAWNVRVILAVITLRMKLMLLVTVLHVSQSIIFNFFTLFIYFSSHRSC